MIMKEKVASNNWILICGLCVILICGFFFRDGYSAYFENVFVFIVSFYFVCASCFLGDLLCNSRLLTTEISI